MPPAAGAHKAPAYLKVHPFGQLPALTCEDGTAVFESGAVILYLADKFGAAKTPEARAAAASWVFWANSSFAPAVFGPTRAAKLPGLLAPLESKLKTSPYLLGDTFTVADCAVGAYLGAWRRSVCGNAPLVRNAQHAVLAYTFIVSCSRLRMLRSIHNHVLPGCVVQAVAGSAEVFGGHRKASSLRCYDRLRVTE